MPSIIQHLSGRVADFNDGVKIKIVQIKQRDTGYWVTYEIQRPLSLEQRFSLIENEFVAQFGKFFGL